MLALSAALMLAFSHVQGGEMKKQTMMPPEGITMKGGSLMKSGAEVP